MEWGPPPPPLKSSRPCSLAAPPFYTADDTAADDAAAAAAALTVLALGNCGPCQPSIGSFSLSSFHRPGLSAWPRRSRINPPVLVLDGDRPHRLMQPASPRQ